MKDYSFSKTTWTQSLVVAFVSTVFTTILSSIEYILKAFAPTQCYPSYNIYNHLSLIGIVALTITILFLIIMVGLILLESLAVLLFKHLKNKPLIKGLQYFNNLGKKAFKMTNTKNKAKSFMKLFSSFRIIKWFDRNIQIIVAVIVACCALLVFVITIIEWVKIYYCV